MFPHPSRLTLKHHALLALFALLLFLPGFFTLPPVDRDEARFAQASKQMLETGDLVSIHFQDETRLKKPVGIYWLQAGSVKLLETVTGQNFSQSIWAYRLPSLLGAVLAVLFTALIGARLFTPQTGFAAGLFMAACLLLNVEARLGKTDAALLAATLACMMVLAKAYVRAGLPQPLKIKDILIFWIALAIGILIKGPIILLPVGGALLMLALTRQPLGWLRHLKPLWGGLLALLIAAPWFYLIMLEAGSDFLKQSAGNDLLAKIWQGQNWGGAVPGFHLAALWGVFWPVSLPFFLSLPWLWQKRKEPAFRFLLAWAIPTWVVFEITFSKLLHYVLPAYPALAILAAAWLLADDRFVPKRWLQIVSVIWGLVSLGLCLGPVFLPVMVEGMPDFGLMFFAGLALSCAVACLYILNRAEESPKLILLPLVAAGGFLILGLFGFMLPGLKNVFVSTRIMEAIPSDPACPSHSVFTAGYNEPSLVFLAGTHTRFLESGAAVADIMTVDLKAPCVIGVIDSSQWNAFTARAIDIQTIATIKGFNYGRGKAVELFVVGPVK